MQAIVNSGDCCEAMDPFRIESLPSGVLALILSKTTPRDVGIASSVSKVFHEVANDDLVWMAFLPPGAKAVIQNVHGEPLAFDSSRNLYHRLTSHLLLGDGTEGYWINRNTGGVCRSFSARTLKIVWGDTPQYWEWGPHENSRFQEVAKLRNVCWLELSGEINTRLPPGAYTLSWVFKLEGTCFGLNHPVTFCTTNLGDSEEIKEVQLNAKQLEANIDNKKSSNSWFYCNVKHIIVENRMKDGDSETLGEVNLSFSMQEIHRGNWKSGLLVDGVIIRAGEFDLNHSFVSSPKSPEKNINMFRAGFANKNRSRSWRWSRCR